MHGVTLRLRAREMATLTDEGRVERKSDLE